MSLTRILFWLGSVLIICAGLMLFGGLVGVAVGEFQQAGIMAILSLCVGVLGAMLIAVTRGTLSAGSNGEAILFLSLYWVVVPVLLSLPYIVLVPDMTRLGAYFEGVSAFTTTGASRLTPSDLPDTLLFWRSLVQWFGGVSVSTFAIVVLAAINTTGTGIHRSLLFTQKKGELFSRLLAIGQLVAGIYLFIALAGFIVMTVSGAPVFEALCLSLSGVATGGLMPRAGPLSLYMPTFSVIVLTFVCLLGAMNVAVMWDAFRLRNLRNLLRMLGNVEHRAIWVAIGILALLGTVYAGLQNFGPLLIDAAFFVSTAGFQNEVVTIDMIPPTVLITVALVGGSALSTAGGIKIVRVLLLFRHLRTDLGRLTHPSRVVPLQFRAQTVSDDAFLSIWMYFLAYIIVLGLGIAALGLVGLDLADSIATGAASLSNMGPLLPLTLPESGLTYAQFTPGQMIVSATLMLIGRVEVLAVIVLLTPTFWRQ